MASQEELFGILRDQLSLGQLLYVTHLWRSIPTDCPPDHIFDVVTAALNSRFKLGVLRSTVKNVLLSWLQNPLIRPLLTYSRIDYTQELDQFKTSCCAVPRIMHCLECGTSLTSKLRRTPAFFYECGKAAVMGSSFYKECEKCVIKYELHGFTRQQHPGCRDRAPKIPYPEHLDHQEWEEVSSETYIHTTVFSRYDAALYYQHSTFIGFCKVENVVTGSDTRFSEANTSASKATAPRIAAKKSRRSERYRLNYQRLEFGYLQRHARKFVLHHCADMLHTFDMSLPLDAQLVQVTPAMFHHHRCQMHEHMTSSDDHPLCGTFLMVDGCCKVNRRRCINKVTVPTHLEPPPGFVYNLKREHYCDRYLGKPASKYQGFCVRCFSALFGAHIDVATSTAATVAAAEGVYEDGIEDMDAEDIVQPQFGSGNAFSAGTSAGAESALHSSANTEETTDVAYRLRSMMHNKLHFDWQPISILEVMSSTTSRRDVLYLIRWKDRPVSNCSYESGADMKAKFGVNSWRCLLQDYQKRQVPSTFYSSFSEEERDKQPTVPNLQDIPIQLVPRRRRIMQQRNPVELTTFFKDCKPRTGDVPTACTYGTMHGFCACGRMWPPWVMIASESCTQVHQYLMSLFDGYDFVSRMEGVNFILGYDDACHLRPFARNPRRLTPQAPALAQSLGTKVDIVVDRFHFNENHTGAYCSKYCSPYKVAALNRPGTNMSVAEQQFITFKKYSAVLRCMNKERFDFMLMPITSLDHTLGDLKKVYC